jgi:Holliday junction resolvase RusA-like endonuclease
MTDLPFRPPPAIIIDIHLPTPPSTNRIWEATKAGPKKYSKSEDYIAWIRHADDTARSMAAFRGLKTIMGKFEARVILQRRKGDLDNRIKGLLDWAQSRNLIADDKYCERLVAEWGEAPLGCRLILKELA